MKIKFVIIVIIVSFLIELYCCNKTLILRRHRRLKNFKKLKKLDGAVKLVGGRDDYEGNVEILHNGKWGAVCDDEWDNREAEIVCKQLGYLSVEKITYNSMFGRAKRRFWMDDIYCNGSEKELNDCHFNGWGLNDCTPEEAAGVICRAKNKKVKMTKLNVSDIKKIKFPNDIKLRVVGGRMSNEGRVEVQFPNEVNWHIVCGDGWSLKEAMVVCRELNLGYANQAYQTNFFGGKLSNFIPGVKCRGNEKYFYECLYSDLSSCPGDGTNIAGVYCVDKMADLVIDHVEIMETAHLEDRTLLNLQCAMEENCVASEAYKIQQESDDWPYQSRRLLRFTARIFNAGTADFRPAIPKNLWEWHMCHMHYHSMEVFATFDIYNSKGIRVADGHKASFCLEDNQCLPGVKPRYACANYGDQGISVNCADIYKYTVDCQWVDITELEVPGIYTFRVAINPEFKIPEISFDNNVATCTFYYNHSNGKVKNCTVGSLH